jgi:hypothetical protein
VFGKLFGRGKPKHDQLGLETSTTSIGIPASDAETTSGPEVSVVATSSATPAPAPWPGMPAVAGMQDLGAILASVKAAQEQVGGDREAMAEILRRQFGGESVVFEQASAVEWSATGPQQDPIALLATLTELHEKGVVSDEQFEAQKRRLLG